MCWLAVAYLVNFLDDGCQSLEEEWEVKEPLVHALHGSEEKLLTALYHLTEHELKILRLHIDLAWLYTEHMKAQKCYIELMFYSLH